MGPEPGLVGIARTRDVSAYPGGVAHSTITDVDYDPFDATYRDHGGARRADRPARRHIWSASARGAGPQTLTWDVQDGNWSVVVMNADGSRGVDAGISAGAELPFLSAAGWGTLGGGTLLLAIAGGVFALAARPPRPRPGATTPEPAPAAS